MLEQVAGELRTLAEATDAQFVAGQVLLQVSQELDRALAANQAPESLQSVEGEAGAAMDRHIARQQQAFQKFRARTELSQRVGRAIQQRFGLQQWDWDSIRRDIVAQGQATGNREKVCWEALELGTRVAERQDALATLLQELVAFHARMESGVQRHLHQLSDQFRVIRQGSVATRAYDSGATGHSGVPSLFIDRTR